MSIAMPSPAVRGSADSGLADLVDEVIRRVQAGESIDPEALAGHDPGLAEQIRRLLPTLEKLADLGGSATGDPAGGRPAVGDAGPGFGMLGDFHLLREVGRGGMGVVYEAEQESLGRRVALKVLPQPIARDGTALSRFRREARSAARLHHTNIVPVFEVGQEGAICYYAMQFIDGQGLDAVIEDLRRYREHGTSSPVAGPAPPSERVRIARSMLTGAMRPEAPAEDGVPLNPTLGFSGGAPGDAPGPAPAGAHAPRPDGLEIRPVAATTSAESPGRTNLSATDPDRRRYFQSVARIGRQVADALAYAHARGVVHRDIKPSNLLLDAAGVVWVTDFGLAKTDEGALTHTGDILGTLRYLAPERFCGACDARADIYALGLTLYELLVLRPAFESPERLRLIEQVRHQEPARPRSLDPRIPRDLETIVLKAIDKDPRNRYPTAAALAEDLQRFVEDRPIQARRVSPTERLWRWCRRNPWIAILSASTVALLLIVAVVSPVMALRERRAKEEMEESLYFNLISLAAREMEARNVGRAEELLAACPPRLRGWEWHYLRRIPRDRPLVLRGHTGRIAGIAYGPVGDRLASISIDLERLGDNGEVKVWDTTSGREIWADRIDASGARGGFWPALAFSRDGRTLAAADLDRSGNRSCDIRIWDAATGRVLRVLQGHPDLVIGLGFSADGDRMVSADSAGRVRLWDAAAGRAIKTFRSNLGPLWSLAYHPDGDRVALGGEDGYVGLWDVTTGRRLLDFQGSGPRPSSLAFNLDGTRLAMGGALGVVKTWDTASGREPFVLPQNPGSMYGVAFIPHAPYLATSSGHGTFRLWDLRSVKEALSIHTAGTLFCIAFSPEGRRLAMALGDRTIRLISAAPIDDAAYGPRIEIPHSGPVCAARYSPDGARVLSAQGGEGHGRPARIRVMEAASGRVLTDVGLIGSRVAAVAFSPDGERLATVDGNGSVVLQDVANHGQAPHTLGEVKAAWSKLAYSADGRWIASNDEGIWRGTKLVIWDARTRRVAHTLDAGPSKLNGLAFSPDGRRVASVGDDVLLRVWDAETGKLLRCDRTGLSSVGPLAFSPDGHQIATAGCGEAGVKIWDTATGRLISDLPGHPGHLHCVAYSPNGRLLASGSADKTVRIWDLATGQETGTLVGHSHWVTDVSFSPDGWRLASASHDGTVKIWDVTRLSGLR
jgi:WD40 repeat protein/serine/threonine protein kinase